MEKRALKVEKFIATLIFFQREQFTFKLNNDNFSKVTIH